MLPSTFMKLQLLFFPWIRLLNWPDICLLRIKMMRMKNRGLIEMKKILMGLVVKVPYLNGTGGMIFLYLNLECTTPLTTILRYQLLNQPPYCCLVPD